MATGKDTAINVEITMTKLMIDQLNNMKGIKVLSLHKKHYPIKELEKFHVEITPKFNRDGLYYNRYEDIAWLERNGRAWLMNASYFLYDLKMFNHKPLTEKCVEAIRNLIRAGIKNKELNELLYIDTQYKELRRIRVGAILFRNKVFKK